MRYWGMLIVLSAMFAAVAENLIFNGNFDHGTAGFALKRTLRPDTNVDLAFTPLYVAGGRLVIDNPYRERYELHSKEFVLKPQTGYQLRLRAIADRDDAWVTVMIYRIVQNNWTTFTHTFELNRELRDGVFEFNTDLQQGGFYHLQIRSGNPAAQIGIASLSLTAVGAPPDQGLEVAVSSDRTLYFPEDNPSAQITVSVKNLSEQPAAGTLKIVGVKEYYDTPAWSKEFAVSLAPGELKKITFAQPVNEYGAVVIRPEYGGSLKYHVGYYAAMGKYRVRPLDLARDFCVGFNGGLTYLWLPEDPAPGYLAINSSPDDRFRLLSQIGCRILRDHDSGMSADAWAVVEPSPGKYNFEPIDRAMALFGKYQIYQLPVIGRSDFIEKMYEYQGFHWPDWVNLRSERVKNDTNNVMNDVRGHILLPPLADWQNYVQKVAERRKGKIQYYEIVNEPNLFLAPETYNRYLQAAAGAIKSMDPQAGVIGYSLSSDFGKQFDDFAAVAFARSKLADVDAVSFHPYGAREVNSATPAALQIDVLRKNVQKYRDLPLWNTELYFVFDGPPHDSYESILLTPDQAAARFLLDLGENVRQSITIRDNMLWKNLLVPNMQHNDNRMELLASENAVAYNALARLFEGATPVEKFKLADDFIVYVYQRDGKALAALWSTNQNKQSWINFDAVTLLDVFGNVLPDGRYPSQHRIYYLLQGNLSREQFVEKLKKLTVTPDVAVGVSPLVRLWGDRAMVALKNEFAQPQEVRISIIGDGFAAAGGVSAVLGPGEAKTLAVPVRITAPVAGGRGKITIAVKGQESERSISWVANPVFSIGDEIKVQNGRLHAAARFSGGNVLEITVSDPTADPASPDRKMWEEDGIELFFDMDPANLPASHPERYQSRTFRVFVVPRRSGEVMTVWPSAANFPASPPLCEVRQQPDGYIARLTFANDFFADPFGFELKVNDVSKSGAALVGDAQSYLKRDRWAIIGGGR